MSGVPMGKVLLRNVIRHTDAHNKIQEESEMWKLRDMEKQASDPKWTSSRGHMHCDRYINPAPRRGRHEEKRCLSDREERDARYWTRKLYDFESNDPDRWGHSGFKELYPEEFKTDSEGEANGDENLQQKKKKLSLDSERGKRSKKPKKKKKKKEKKKQSQSDSNNSGGDEDCGKERRKDEKSKRRKKRAQKQIREDTSDSDSSRQKRTWKKVTDKMEALPQKRKKRKNWKEGHEAMSSED
ncbi:uncharacterized protein NKAPD1 [Denticeps clupeoides]|uniref:Uncharacterized protein n=1 Tax=Denticeps clupeoides TaxID=299321 RepID=A0AAY4AI71_9TELE|nr:uncharacterized protein NKAPD1 [Denticeps clupeoides]